MVLILHHLVTCNISVLIALINQRAVLICFSPPPPPFSIWDLFYRYSKLLKPKQKGKKFKQGNEVVTQGIQLGTSHAEGRTCTLTVCANHLLSWACLIANIDFRGVKNSLVGVCPRSWTVMDGYKENVTIIRTLEPIQLIITQSQ